MKAKNRYRNRVEVLKEYEITQGYRQNGITKEKCELFSKLMKQLHYNVYSTYLGADCIKTQEDVDGHFNWAFNKTVEFFKECGYKITNKKNVKSLHKILRTYFIEQYYKFGGITDDVLNYKFENLFKYEGTKDKESMAEMIEVYFLVDSCFEELK